MFLALPYLNIKILLKKYFDRLPFFVTNFLRFFFSILDGESALDKPTKDNLNERSLKPHEKRALNFLINEYLLLQSYKLTSITFSDENPDQVIFRCIFYIVKYL